jgi:hypothetical protein
MPLLIEAHNIGNLFHREAAKKRTSEEKAINWLSSRPSLSSILRGEKVTVPKSFGLI